ncbi:MAG: hypothetical protein DSY85_08545 [Marinomonas sp.]|nr:MAG: hypothetical protein DSY85_08545 [Marinomonas sp.]
MKAIDIVGDVHGQSDEFESLLIKMGYKPFKQGFRHPDRKLIMVGDLIDGTGTANGQRRVLEIAKSMVDNDDATVIMGNHEFNAICYATKMPDGNYARTHNEKNFKQHELFLEAFPFGSSEYWQAIRFFKELPLWIDTPSFRVVHACWNDSAMKRLEHELDDENRLNSDKVFVRFGNEQQPLFDDLELILKGPEIKLPEGISFKDKYGHIRTNARVRWWNAEHEQSKSLAVDDALQQKYDLAEAYQAASQYRYTSEVPVFFGHYWIAPEKIEEVSNSPAVCLDYSVARRGGKLVAIRLNNLFENSEWFSVQRES